MKKVLSIALMSALVAAFALPVFAGEDGQEQVRNVRVGSRNAAGAMHEYMDGTAGEAAKGKTTGEHLTGVAAGSIVGVRKGIHRVGAGAIDLLTFWIPKKQPLVTPEEPRLK